MATTSTSSMSSHIQIDRVTCPLCQGVLWNPKACKHCQIHYCSECLKNRQSESFKCPSTTINCPNFEERRQCHTLTMNHLRDLMISCVNSAYNCTEVLPYDQLEAHEKMFWL